MTSASVKISLASAGVCAGFGAFGEAELEAGIISLSASPSTIAHPGIGPGTFVTLNPLGATFLQYNDTLGKLLYAYGGFRWANVAQGQRIDANIAFQSTLGLGTSAAGDRLFAFRQGNRYGWIKENLGGSGGAITFISGAFNDGTDLNNDFINAGTLTGGGGGGGGAAVPEPGTTGLMGLAALAAGATAIRRRRAAAATVSVDSAT